MVATSDEMAFGAMHAAHEIGLQIPRDISLVGIDGHSLASFLRADDGESGHGRSGPAGRAARRRLGAVPAGHRRSRGVAARPHPRFIHGAVGRRRAPTYDEAMTDEPGQSRVTLAQVAAHAGVSTGAVSQVLNEHPNTRISAAARARIAAAVEELGYRPNMVARSLRRSKSETYGFVSDAVSITRYASGILRGALSEVLQAGPCAADRRDRRRSGARAPGRRVPAGPGRRRHRVRGSEVARGPRLPDPREPPPGQRQPLALRGRDRDRPGRVRGRAHRGPCPGRGRAPGPDRAHRTRSASAHRGRPRPHGASSPGRHRERDGCARADVRGPGRVSRLADRGRVPRRPGRCSAN